MDANSTKRVQVDGVAMAELLLSCSTVAYDRRDETFSLTRETLDWLLSISDINPEPVVSRAIRQMLGEVAQ